MMMKRFVLLAILVSPGAQAVGPTLPDGAGKVLVTQTCTKCHSSALIVQQRLDRNEWNQIITRMQTDNGLWELDGPTRKTILDYLEAHFSPKDAGGGMEVRPVNPLPRRK